MCAQHDKEQGGYHLTTVAWSILVMGLSLAAVIILWIWFGWIGPNFSDGVLREQQETLREQYGLPPAPEVTPEQAQIPPSLRGK